jgi:hypothetical protein
LSFFSLTAHRHTHRKKPWLCVYVVLEKDFLFFATFNNECRKYWAALHRPETQKFPDALSTFVKRMNSTIRRQKRLLRIFPAGIDTTIIESVAIKSRPIAGQKRKPPALPSPPVEIEVTD